MTRSLQIRALLVVSPILAALGCAMAAPEEHIPSTQVITLKESVARNLATPRTLAQAVDSAPDVPSVFPSPEQFPSAKEDPAHPSGLSRGSIKQIIDGSQPVIERCYHLALQEQPTTAGKVEVKFLIGPTGSVLAAEVDESTVGFPLLAECVRRTLGALQFPKPVGGGTVRVSYPYFFRVNP